MDGFVLVCGTDSIDKRLINLGMVETIKMGFNCGKVFFNLAHCEQSFETDLKSIEDVLACLHHARYVYGVKEVFLTEEYLKKTKKE